MSEIKVNKISPRTACGTTTLGDSGDTFTIPAGVTISNSGTASGFGSTGEVSWNTTKITADPGPAVSGVGYFTDTSGAAFNVTLPSSPSAGSVIAVADYANSWDSNNLTILRNGSNIEGAASNFICNQEGSTITFVYVDATKGWVCTNSGNSTQAFGENFISATGGTITECGSDKIHTFTGPGTFTVCSVATNAANNEVSYMVIAGGGGGGRGSGLGAGGGAGGFRETKSPVTPYTASPLCGYSTPGNRITVTATAFPITVGAGGATKPTAGQGNTGSPSTFSTITSAGGGGGGGGTPTPALTGIAGGSGGGGAENGGATGSGGAGNTPPVTPAQGNAGGAGVSFPAPNSSGTGGGGGATSAGIIAAAPYGAGGGGNGATSSINGTPTTRGGGGGGSGYGPANPNSFAGNPGPGGGGRGAFGPDSDNTLAIAGTANTGGGGGGGVGTSAAEGTGAAGGSGIVIIRYKFQ
jgi:hypothetical protein